MSKAADDKYTQHLATTMKLLRELKGISLREHAAQMQLSPATLSRIENAKTCDLSTLVWISEKTGISINTLLGLKP